MIRWADPQFFWLYFVCAAAGLFVAWSYLRRKALLKGWTRTHLLDTEADEVNWSRRSTKAVLWVGFLFVLATALLGPQWGTRWEEINRRGADIIVALDVSKSMLAEDVKPNRLARAKLAIKDLVSQLEGDRVGLVVFAGSAFLQCPLTVDYSAFSLNLDAVGPELIPRGGTRLERAIDIALDAFEKASQGSQVLILISDGEEHEGQAVRAAEEAAEKGVRIFSIGIGTPEGELIPVPSQSGGTEFLKNRQGEVVKSRLNEAALRQVALSGNGAYVRATAGSVGLDRIYAQYIEPLDDKEFDSQLKQQHILRYQWPLAAAFVWFLIEPLISDRRSKRTKFEIENDAD